MAGAAALAGAWPLAARGQGNEAAAPPPPEAAYWTSLSGGRVRCELCPHHCVVPAGRRGACRVRENRDGRYVSLSYGRVCAGNADAIEKKPFFHVLPGTRAWSIATVGCNFTCRFCQNWDISQARPEERPGPYRAPADVAADALARNCRSVAYTYSEPVIFFEYARDCALAARERGLANVVVSNGYIEAAPLADWCRVMTAIKIDFKAHAERFYAEVCGGRLTPVLDTLKRLAASGIWFELVMLLIPTLNDGADQIRRLAAWVASELGPEVPLHFTRFHPAYRLRNLPPTPPATLQEARRLAMTEGCRFVYTGNLPGHEGETTRCPDCGLALIERYGHQVMANRLDHGACPACHRRIPGIWA